MNIEILNKLSGKDIIKLLYVQTIFIYFFSRIITIILLNYKINNILFDCFFVLIIYLITIVLIISYYENKYKK